MGLDKNLTRGLQEQRVLGRQLPVLDTLARLFFVTQHAIGTLVVSMAVCPGYLRNLVKRRAFRIERDLAAFGLGKYLEETLTSFL